MLNVEQFFEDDNVDQNGNNAIKLEDEVENALVCLKLSFYFTIFLNPFLSCDVQISIFDI